MIANEREYKITRAAAKRFEDALAKVDERSADQHPLARKAMRESIESELEILREELAQYEALRSGRVAAFELQSLSDLPDVLIQARTSAGLTQRQLAERLGLKEQQVQRYEASRYASVSLERLQVVADALGVSFRETVSLPLKSDTELPEHRSQAASSTPPNLSGVLRRTGLTLHGMASSLNIPNGFALKLQRGRIDPESIPDHFANRLGEFLRVDAAQVRRLVGSPALRGRNAQLRVGKGQDTSSPAPLGVEGFREALAASPDLTAEQRHEWLDGE